MQRITHGKGLNLPDLSPTLCGMSKGLQTPQPAAMALPPQKIKLTNRFIESRKAAGQGALDHYHDSHVPGLALRITATGSKSFVLYGRFPSNPKVFTRLSMGRYPGLSLDEARKKARKWQGLVERGLDPRVDEERQRLSQARQAQNTVSVVFDAFVDDRLIHERKGLEVARDLRKDMLPKLGQRPITDVARIEIREIIKQKKKTAPAQARNLLGYMKRFFSWALDQEIYGLEASPCSDIRATEIIGRKKRGERVLSDEEIFALWRAAGRELFPFRQVYQLLMLNALRLNEAADAALSEFEFAKRDWTIPGDRMKGRNSEARPHLVPLADWSLQIIGELPTLSDGPFLFSCNFGRSPVWIGSKVKQRLDARMIRTMRAIARKGGKDPKKVELLPWVNHDIRRTVRTNLSALKSSAGIRIPDEVKEAVIAHVRPGIKGVYDKHEYADEKFEAISVWADRLATIIGNNS